jgi:hypothetical protein
MSKLQQELADVNIDACLSTLDYEAEYNGSAVNMHLYYFPYCNASVDVDPLLILIKNSIITKFVNSYKTIIKHYQRKPRKDADARLFEKAINKFSKHTAKGKIGELLLFLFIEEILGAPKILTKISMIQDRNDQVKGADAVHAQIIDNNLVLYLGESKLWSNYSGACGDAVSSMLETISSFDEEFDLMEDYIDFPNFDDKLGESIINIINPYEDGDQDYSLHFPCFIGFDSAVCRKISSKEEYNNKYRKSAQRLLTTFFGKVNAPLSTCDITLILLPFNSIDEFTDKFLDVMDITS